MGSVRCCAGGASACWVGCCGGGVEGAVSGWPVYRGMPVSRGGDTGVEKEGVVGGRCSEWFVAFSGW